MIFDHIPNNDEEFAALWKLAEDRAYEAARMADADLGPEQSRGLDCGFAWVTIRPATGKFINWCRKNNIGSKSYSGGWQFWCTKYSQTQSISVHEAAARAVRDTLTQGLQLRDCSVGSRLD